MNAIGAPDDAGPPLASTGSSPTRLPAMTQSIAAFLSRSLTAKALSAGLALAMGLAFAHPAQAGVSFRVRFAPPPLLVYEQPLIPAPGYIWVPGYWAWDDDVGDYYWVPGQWVMPPFAGALWTPGYWAWDGGMYLFHDGYWGPTVGYYGGIDYGYGYFGVDYVGGYWNRGVFNYNRAYNRIDNRVVHVYNRTTIVNRNGNRVSYNGGPGGIATRPTPRQRDFDRQRHWDPVPAQREAMQHSRGDRSAHYGYSHGQGDRPQWRGVPAANPPAAPSAQPGGTAPQPPQARTTPQRPPRNMMPTDGVPGPQTRPPRPSFDASANGAPGQPPHPPRQWEGARERVAPPERAMREEHRPPVRPPMPAPQLRPQQPMPMHAPPAARPVPPQAPHGGGNPHRDDHRREHRDSNGG